MRAYREEKNSNRINENQLIIMSFMSETNDNLTCREIANRAMIDTHVCSSRISELVKMGLLFTSHKVTCSETNKVVTTYTSDESRKVKHDTIIRSNNEKGVKLLNGLVFDGKAWYVYKNGFIVGKAESEDDAKEMMI